MWLVGLGAVGEYGDVRIQWLRSTAKSVFFAGGHGRNDRRFSVPEEKVCIYLCFKVA